MDVYTELTKVYVDVKAPDPVADLFEAHQQVCVLASSSCDMGGTHATCMECNAHVLGAGCQCNAQVPHHIHIYMHLLKMPMIYVIASCAWTWVVPA